LNFEQSVFPFSFKLSPTLFFKGWKLNLLRWLNYIPVLGPLYTHLQARLLNITHANLFRFDFSHQPGTVQSNAAISCLIAEQDIISKQDFVSKQDVVSSSPLLSLAPSKHQGFRFPDCKLLLIIDFLSLNFFFFQLILIELLILREKPLQLTWQRELLRR
jgi:hypothetical protein